MLTQHEFSSYHPSVLNENLKREREARGWSRGDLARKSGVHENTIADIERGRSRMPAHDKVVQLARALGMTPDELCPVEREIA